MKKVPPEVEAQIVRLHFGEQMKIGEVASLLDVHHSVVRRVLRPMQVPAPSFALRPCKIDEYRPWLIEMLEVHPKIRASRLFTMVRERGYTGGISQLRACVRLLRPKPKFEAFLRLHKLIGEEAQVDWGHFGKVIVGRAVRPLVMFAMTLSYSRAVYLQFYHDAQMPNFQAGHVAAFLFFEGVPRVLLYDNLKSAVLERVGDLKRFNPDLLELANHYRFEPRAAKPARGNEKGRVERTIRYVRDSFFAAREFTTLEQLNAEARKWCQMIAAQRKWPQDRERTVQEVWDEEKAKLRKLPDDDFQAAHRILTTVGKTPYVRFDKNDYSVPHSHVRQNVVIVATDRSVRIMDNDALLAEHQRSYSRGEVIENAEHVADLVTWKRKAGESSAMARLIHAAPSAKKWLETAALRGNNLGHQTRKLQEFLLAYGAQELESGLASFNDRETVHLPSLQNLLDDQRKKKNLSPYLSPVILPSRRLENVIVHPHDLNSYASLNATEEEGDHEE
jgi:transposase